MKNDEESTLFIVIEDDGVPVVVSVLSITSIEYAEVAIDSIQREKESFGSPLVVKLTTTGRSCSCNLTGSNSTLGSSCSCSLFKHRPIKDVVVLLVQSSEQDSEKLSQVHVVRGFLESKSSTVVQIHCKLGRETWQ
jgi:hypothetical protein